MLNDERNAAPNQPAQLSFVRPNLPERAKIVIEAPGAKPRDAANAENFQPGLATLLRMVDHSFALTGTGPI